MTRDSSHAYVRTFYFKVSRRRQKLFTCMNCLKEICVAICYDYSRLCCAFALKKLLNISQIQDNYQFNFLYAVKINCLCRFDYSPVSWEVINLCASTWMLPRKVIFIVACMIEVLSHSSVLSLKAG